MGQAAEQRRVAARLRPEPQRHAVEAGDGDADAGGERRARATAGDGQRHGDGGERRDHAEEQRARDVAEGEAGGGEERVDGAHPRR